MTAGVDARPQRVAGAQAAARVAAGYRADIDGLRAVAVLSVAGYHAALPGFSGGYIGVDVFFVISGFLITRIILSALEVGRFSLTEFYERRARRILPALFVVTAFVVTFTLIYRAPRDADIFGESVSLFAVFGANFFFYNQLDYFSDPVEFYPLLHMWSLAVEEQFYIFFPLLLMALLPLRRAWLTPALAGLAALSLAASAALLPVDPKMVFFLTPFRMWELLAGALLAARPELFQDALDRIGARQAASAIGLALCLAPVALYDDATPFPGLAALPPVLGAALLIAAGAPRRHGVGAPPLATRALSWPPLVYVGLASYSFYLWHWPALSAARYMSFEPLSAPAALGVLALAFAASVASLHCVERPFRRPGGVLSRRGVFAAGAGGVVVLLLVGWALQEAKGWPGRYPELAPLLAEDSFKYGSAPGTCVDARDALPAGVRGGVDPGFCRLRGDAEIAGQAGAEIDRRRAEAERVVLLWGDSHLGALTPGFAAQVDATGADFYSAWSAICPPALGYDRPIPTRFHDCAAHNEATLAAADALGATDVVLAARWRNYPPEAVASQVADAVRALVEQGRRVSIVAQAPRPDVHAPTFLFRAAVTGASPNVDFSPERLNGADQADGAAQRQILDAARAAGAAVIDLTDALCDGGRCRIAGGDGGALYADGHHLSRNGAREAVAGVAPALFGPR